MSNESSPDQALATELDRLRKDSRELRALYQHLSNCQASYASQANVVSLEGRLQRVEASIVFRFLRWLGALLASVGLPVERGLPTLPRSNRPGSLVDRNYATWVQETSLLQSIRSTPATGQPGAILQDPRPSPASSALVSILLDCSQPDRERLERTLASLDSQQHSAWDLLVCAGTVPPDWLEACVSARSAGQSVEIIHGKDARATLECALAKCRGEFVAVVASDAILDPDALATWLADAEPGTAAVYSDWDHIDARGRRHTPRFTPENSPELLSHTLYWGRCYLARTAELRETRLSADAPTLPVEHELALRLAGHSKSIERVPRILWHLQKEPSTESVEGMDAVPTLPPHVKSSEAGTALRASIIICSRNPDNLRKCLKALLPTLGGNHEVIIVAHQTGDGQGVEQVAANYGVRVVPYDGAFHFGVMNGLGVKASTGQAICFMNDDVFPIAADWLDSMLAQAARPEVGIVGALLLYPNGTVQHAGVAVGGWYLPAHVGRFRLESPYWPWLRITREVTAVTGACMLLRRAVWDELGGFDPWFPVNYNDIDLCLKAGQRGYRILIEARAVLTHEESQTRVPVVRPEESELFYQRWGAVMRAPDKFFNPQLSHLDDTIQLPSPWTLVR